MIKRSDTAKKNKLKSLQPEICVKISKKKEKTSRVIESVSFTRITRSKKTVHSNSPRASHSPKILKKPIESVRKIEEKKKYFTRSTKISEKTAQSNEIKLPNLGNVSLKKKKEEERKIAKRADFVRLDNFEVGTICLSKQKWSFPWPARVIKVEKKKVLVYFFGDKRVGYVEPLEIYDFVKSSHALRLIIPAKKKSSPNFITGLVEVEMLLQINSNYSLLNNI